MIMKVFSGAPMGPESEERLAELNEQLEQRVQVSKAGCIRINLESKARFPTNGLRREPLAGL
jgi:hypothetical protein